MGGGGGGGEREGGGGGGGGRGGEREVRRKWEEGKGVGLGTTAFWLLSMSRVNMHYGACCGAGREELK